MTDYDLYTAPPLDSSFSPQFFQDISIEDLVNFDGYPLIAPEHSVRNWEWSEEVPRSTVATTLLPHEVIPHVADLACLFDGMRDGFRAGYRSVVVEYHHQGVEYKYCFSFSKVRSHAPRPVLSYSASHR